ncbi:hypothetical protein TWF696_009775 [Orbilia brochopaga]|uniref:Uncharacterized protein n=1 Tax=Orbilia brochopaga TaxID=3140254 RepID=A0AAV9UBZ3_9PEZI
MTEPGGFFPPSTNYLPSPTPSNYSSTAARTDGILPTPRSTPLKPGSKRESALINYIDAALLDISRKFTKKFPGEEEQRAGDIVGYRDVEPLIVDLERMIGLVWVSGTASLQIAYLLQIASSLLQYLPPFPPRPTPTFRLFNKLDLAFHTLLAAHSLSATEKVRLNSIVKVSRAMVLRLMEGQDFPDEDIPKPSIDDDDDDDDSDDDDSDLDLDKEETDDDDEMQVDAAGDAARLQQQYGRPTQREIDRTERTIQEEKEDDDWEIEVARVYSRVLEDIGGEIGGDPIGIVVDE